MQKTKLQRCGKTLLTYTAVLLLMAVVGCVLLYLTGLDTPSGTLQKRIDYGIAQSTFTFEREGVYPTQRQRSTRLDNFTEMLILGAAKYTNTALDPLSIFKNPRYADASGNAIVSFQAIANGAEPNTEYSRYWMGFRVFVRPLLMLLDYEGIREILRFTVLALFALTAASVCRHTGPKVTVAFVLAMALFEMGTVSSIVQYSTCFVLAMLAMLALPKVKQRKHCTMFFFIIGGVTQYFDFYTAPSITLGLPLVYSLFLAQPKTNESVNRLKGLFQCIVAWLAAYAGMAVLRAALVSLFLGRNEFAVIAGSFAKWTGLEQGERYSDINALSALQSVWKAVLSKAHILMLAGMGVCFLAALVRKWRRDKCLCRPDYLLLACALIPIVWICVTCKATEWHVFFQYRTLVTLVFACFCFFASLLEDAGKPNGNGTLKEQG